MNDYGILNGYVADRIYRPFCFVWYLLDTARRKTWCFLFGHDLDVQYNATENIFVDWCFRCYTREETETLGHQQPEA